MMVSSCEGPRTVDDGDVVLVHRGEECGRYVVATLILSNGTEVSGLCLADALMRLEDTLRAAA